MNPLTCPGCGGDAPIVEACPTCAKDLERLRVRERSCRETLAREREERRLEDERRLGERAADHVQIKGLTALYEQKVQEQFAVRQTMIRRRSERLWTALELVEKRMGEYEDMARRLAELGYPAPKTIEVRDEHVD